MTVYLTSQLLLKSYWEVWVIYLQKNQLQNILQNLPLLEKKTIFQYIWPANIFRLPFLLIKISIIKKLIKRIQTSENQETELSLSAVQGTPSMSARKKFNAGSQHVGIRYVGAQKHSGFIFQPKQMGGLAPSTQRKGLAISFFNLASKKSAKY